MATNVPDRISGWGDPRIVDNLFRDNTRPPKKPLPKWLQSEKSLAELAGGIGTVTRASVRFQFLKFVRDQRTNVVVTLTISPRTSFVTFGTQADKFINAILQEAHGRNWARLPLSIRPVAIGFLEHPYENPHYHLVMRADEKFHYALLVRGQDIWRKLMSHGHVNVQVMRSEDDVVRYCAKEQVTLDRFATAYLYAPMRSGNLAER